MSWGASGVVLALLLWHFYTDHVALHTIVNLINENAARTSQPPASTP